jgi:hypothetical protein
MSFPFVQPYFGLGNSLQTAQAGGAGGIGGWVELGRTTFGGGGKSYSVDSLPDKRYYMILVNNFQSAQTEGDCWRVNSDSGSNYSGRSSLNGASDTTFTSKTKTGFFGFHPYSQPSFAVSHYANLSSKEKLGITHAVGHGSNVSGAGNAPDRGETIQKWANTSNSIDEFQQFNAWNNYDSGSEMVVLGWDPDDTHTTNFWEELASIDTTTSSDMDTGTFTAKKYLWVQLFVEASGGIIYDARFNGDSGSNYAYRKSTNGGADGTTTSDSVMFSNHGFGSHPHYENWFIINNASNEKLVIGNSMSQGSAGAGNAPNRQERAGKWANTSDQITQITINNGGISTRYVCKVWGSD